MVLGPGVLTRDPRWHVRFFLVLFGFALGLVNVLGLGGTASATSAAVSAGNVLPVYDGPVHVYDGAHHSVAAHTSEVQPLTAGNVLDGAQVTASGVSGPLFVVLPESVAANSGLTDLVASRVQLEAKFKHAADFGVTDARGATGFDSFGTAVDSFVGDASTVRVPGTYRGDPAILNYNSTSGLVVVQDTSGAFVSGWQLSPAQLANVIKNASLGGG